MYHQTNDNIFLTKNFEDLVNLIIIVITNEPLSWYGLCKILKFFFCRSKQEKGTVGVKEDTPVGKSMIGKGKADKSKAEIGMAGKGMADKGKSDKGKAVKDKTVKGVINKDMPRKSMTDKDMVGKIIVSKDMTGKGIADKKLKKGASYKSILETTDSKDRSKFKKQNGFFDDDTDGYDNAGGDNPEMRDGIEEKEEESDEESKQKDSETKHYRWEISGDDRPVRVKPEIIIPNFEQYRKEMKFEMILKAMNDFIIRKERVTSSKELSFASIAFIRPSFAKKLFQQ